MDIDDLQTANNLSAKRLKLMSIKTSLQGTGPISASGSDLQKLLTPERMTAARGTIATIINADLANVEAARSTIAALINAELTDVESALADIGVQTEQP